MSDELRFQLVDLRAKVPSKGPNGTTPLSEVSISGHVEMVVEIPDAVEVPVPGLEDIAYYWTSPKAIIRIEVDPDAVLTMSKTAPKTEGEALSFTDYLNGTRTEMHTASEPEWVSEIRAMHRVRRGVKFLYAADDYHAEREPIGEEEYFICEYDKTTWPCKTQQIIDRKDSENGW